jgi:hypothetical protein
MEAFLDTELGRTLIPPDAVQLEQQRQRFLQRYGPERLREMSVDELLNALPPDKGKDSMDYWLEFKKTEEFNTDLFGGIRGGSSAKFGVWLDKTGDWRLSETGGPTIVKVDEARAREVVRKRRDQAVAAAAVVTRYAELEVTEIEGAEFHDAILAAAPDWGDSVWMHKYLHLVCPERVT